MQQQLVIKTISLPHCWICGTRFRCSVPPGPAQREDHHIIPQAQGGTDGPTVSLCDSHHTALHKIAHRMHKRATWEDLVLYESEQARKQLEWLASCVYRAEVAMKDDPNKRSNVLLSTDARQRQMLDYLKTVTPVIPNTPKITSRTAALAYALELAVLLHKQQESKR